MSERPSVDVAVVLRKRRLSSPWQPWKWELAEVLPDEDGFGSGPRLLHQDADGERWLHPRQRVELFRDESEGYYINATSPAPCWFVLWRMEEQASVAPEPIPRPLIVTRTAALSIVTRRRSWSRSRRRRTSASGGAPSPTRITCRNRASASARKASAAWKTASGSRPR